MSLLCCGCSVHGSAAMETLQQDMDLNDLEVQVMETVMTQLRDTSEEGFVKDAAAGEQAALDPSMIDIESIPGEFVRGDPTLDADPWLPPIVDVSDASTDTQPATVSSMDRGGVDGTAGGSSIEFGGIGFGLVNNGSEHLNSSTETDAVNTVTSFPDIDSGLLSDVSSEPMPQGESEVVSVDKEADREKGVGSDDSAAVAADAAGDAPSALEASVREVEEEVVANGIETDPAARDDAVTTLETGLTADFSDVGIGRVEPTPSDAAADSPAVGETADQQSEVKNESLLADLTVPGEEVNPVGEGGTVDSGDVVDSTDRRAGENVPGSDASSPSAQVASQDDGVVVEDNTAVASDIGAVKVDDTVHVTVEGEASSADSMKPVNQSSAADVNKTITEQTESTPLDKTVETMDYDSVDSDIVSGDTNEDVNQTEFESAGTGKGVKNNATINESNVSSPTEQSTPESLNDSTETELNRTFNAYTASIATEAEDFVEKLDNSSTTIPPVSGSSDPAVSERNDTNATSNIVSVTAYSTSENKSDTVGDKEEKIATSGASMRNGTANETADQGVERSGNSSNHELQQHSTSSENVTRNNSESVNGSSIGGANVTGNGSAVANVTKPPVVAGEAPTLPAGEGSTVQDSASSSPSNIPSTAHAAIAAHGARVKSVNMSCLDNLKYSEFRDKMMSKLEGSTSDSSNSTTMGSAPQGSQDSVFKPLISKIKKLEMKNLINEMYTNQIGDCHRSIFSEILSSWGPNGSMTTAARDALLTLNEAIEGIDSRTVAAASVLDETVSFVKEQRNILQLQAGAFGFYGPLEEGAYLNSSVLAEEIVFNNISRARRVVDSHKAGCDRLSCLPKYLKFLYEVLLCLLVLRFRSYFHFTTGCRDTLHFLVMCTAETWKA